MAHRTILTDRQKSALFDLPTDEPSQLKHYTLADDDLEYINQRRRAHNKLGFALQLCALRYPGRPLGPGEVIPHEVSLFLAAQLGLKADDLIEYATREETRHDHMSALRSIYGYRAFSGRAARDLKLWLDGQAEDARSNEDAYSGAIRPPVPMASGHPFRFDPAGDSGVSGHPQIHLV